MNKEEHLILRLPEDWTRSLNSDSKIELGSIELEQEEPGRVFRVKFGQVETFAFLLDLPCIVETHKTLDDVNFFKNTDIAQMIYVIPEYEKDEPRAKRSSLSKMLEKGQRYKLKSGITPGTFNITSRFYKREMDVQLEDIKKVEGFIKSVMDVGTVRLIEEEIIEIPEGEMIPEDREYTYDPNSDDESNN